MKTKRVDGDDDGQELVSPTPTRRSQRQRTQDEGVDWLIQELSCKLLKIHGKGFCWASAVLAGLDPQLQPHAQEDKEGEYSSAEKDLELKVRTTLQYTVLGLKNNHLLHTHPGDHQGQGADAEKIAYVLHNLRTTQSRRHKMGQWGGDTILLWLAL